MAVGESCASPQVLTSTTNSLSGTLLGTTDDFSGGCEATGSGDRVYAINVTTAPKRLQASVFGNGFTAALSLASSGCAELACAAGPTSTTSLDTWLEDPGTYFVVVQSTGTMASYSANVSVTAPPQPIVLTRGVGTSVSGSKYSYQMYSFTVITAVQTMTITLTGNVGDADLYESATTPPLTATSDNASTATGTAETISVALPPPGTYYFLVYGYSDFSGAVLTVTTN
jgi:hypothetical protein